MINEKKNNHTLIIGGSSGIGKELAIKFAEQESVSVIARRLDKLDALESVNTNIFSSFGDVTSLDSLKKSIEICVENFGKVDRLIYCAGKQVVKPHRLISNDDIDSLLDINLKGALFASKIFLSSKISEKNAVFCAISSIASIKPEPGIVTYSAMKAGIDAMIKGLAKESAPRRFIGIAPGWLDTEMTQSQQVYNESFRIELEKKSPLGLTQISDIVNAVEFLTCKEAISITGTILVVDSGSVL
ncbi:SDR family oxidoreductase [Gammaproteobacteria bacterium]|jgi:NAD(P)-dependent dehydrogenase (short-subunit alcohol dehydrogenase family)|nr:SDR family oxidoreductase [Gammaproteobacteria bacterium]